MIGTRIKCISGFTIAAHTGKQVLIEKDDILWITTSEGYFNLKKAVKIARLSQKKCGIGWDITKSQLDNNFQIIEQ